MKYVVRIQHADGRTETHEVLLGEITISREDTGFGGDGWSPAAKDERLHTLTGTGISALSDDHGLVFLAVT